MLSSLIVAVIACVETGSAFLPMGQTTHHRNRQKQMGSFLIHTDTVNIGWSRSRLADSAAASDETVAADNSGDKEDDIGSMRVSEIKKELVRLNVSSKDCFDRESLVEKLIQARQQPQTSQSQPESSQPEQSTKSASESSATATATTSRDETNTAPTAGTSTNTASTDTKSPQELQEEVSALSIKELRTGRMRPSQVTDLTADELTQELTSTNTLVLLDVYATW
jgi:hypothetical protein